MAEVKISSGGVRSNLRAGEDLLECTLFKYSSTENEVIACGSGEEADGIVIQGYYVTAYEDPMIVVGELLNQNGGKCFSRQTTGIYEGVTYSGSLTVGAEWMSDASGQIVAYVASSDNRALGKVLALDDTDSTAKISFYSK